MTAKKMTNAEEAMATHEELKNAYGSEFHAPRKRFRVEGTPIGNSRLLMKSSARDTQERHGGSVVEVIPHMPSAVRHAANMPACPRCEVAAGKPCRSRTGKLAEPHTKRWEAFHELD